MIVFSLVLELGVYEFCSSVNDAHMGDWFLLLLFLPNHAGLANDVLKRQEPRARLVSAVLSRHQSQVSKTEEPEAGETKRNGGRVSPGSEGQRKMVRGSGMSRHSSDDEDLGDGKWKIELAWLTKALEPALQMCRWALPTGILIAIRVPPRMEQGHPCENEEVLTVLGPSLIAITIAGSFVRV